MKKYFFALLIVFTSCKKEATIDMTPINAKGKILFISRRISNSADWQMFTMNADGSNQKLVSNNLVRCSQPIISNSGTRIAFTTYDNNFFYNLYIIGIDGQNEILLSRCKQFCGSPVWSPDDARIAFVKNDNIVGGNCDIYSIKTDGTDEIKLTNQGDNFSPEYLPDNSSIIFSSSNSNSVSIYKMSVDGSNKKLLTPQNKSFGDPKISPNGDKVAITSNDWNGSQIFVMNSDGSNLQQLTFTVSSKYFDTGFPRDGNGNPVWSPNSEKLAYVSYENGSPDIFVINSNGTANKRLTDTPLRDENPTWTKDGNYILFSSNRNSNDGSQIYIMRTEGQLQTNLTNYVGDNICPIIIDK
jgi:Tol biopolymer transport system component